MADQSLRVPIFCPVSGCGTLMKGKSTYTYYDYGCCIDCYIWFLEGRPGTIKRWKEGWRPNEDEMAHYREMMKN